MMFINPNASPGEIVKSGEEVSASLYGDIIYEGLDLLRYGKFTRKVSESPYIAPTSAAASYHSKRAYLELQEWAETKYHHNPLEWGEEMWTEKDYKNKFISCT